MEHSTIYTSGVITRLELGWGLGWLSPGGRDDVFELMAGTDLSGTSVLDIGAGARGPALLLAREFCAGHVTGIDVEQSVLDRAQNLALANELEEHVTFKLVVPGRLPFSDGEFDAVFSKDAFVHIACKSLLFAEVFRVLKPGGRCIFSDWCCGTEPLSVEMNQFLNNGMNFSMATIDENHRQLECAAFVEISVVDRNAWFVDVAEREVSEAMGAKRSRMVTELGREGADSVTFAARRRAVIAKQGHLRPAHFRARKPTEF